MLLNLRSVGAAKAKATLLALLDEVEMKREPIILTKNGRPVARLIPMPLEDQDPILGFYKGNLEIVGDVISPIYTDEEQGEFETRSIMQLAGSDPFEDDIAA